MKGLAICLTARKISDVASNYHHFPKNCKILSSRMPPDAVLPNRFVGYKATGRITLLKSCRQVNYTVVRCYAHMKTIVLNRLKNLTHNVLSEVIEYLDERDVFVPDFRHAIHKRICGSYFSDAPAGPFLHLGCYPTRFIAEWWVMHEVGHVLWHFYEPCRDRKFAKYFGAPRPDDYDDIHRKLAFYGPIAATLGLRPRGEPSPYGRDGGGEERFCELIGLMYATGGFDQHAPKDLQRMWSACWNNGLARMTNDNVRNA